MTDDDLKAFNEGAEAYRKDDRARHNPYGKDDPLNSAWDRGWRFASDTEAAFYDSEDAQIDAGEWD